MEVMGNKMNNPRSVSQKILQSLSEVNTGLQQTEIIEWVFSKVTSIFPLFLSLFQR